LFIVQKQIRNKQRSREAEKQGTGESYLIPGEKRAQAAAEAALPVPVFLLCFDMTSAKGGGAAPALALV